MKAAAREQKEKHPFLVGVGEQVRTVRARRGMTRKQLAVAANVSERHLANLEHGVGNASLLLLLQVAGALQCTFVELVGDITASSPEWLLIRELLQNCDEPTLKRMRVLIGEALGTGGGQTRAERIALIGLRGAGKSTLGRMLADRLEFPFIELSREIEKFAGCSIAEIQALYGAAAYRRYEQRALEELVQIYPDAVIATPGGLVSDAGTFNALLAHCTTVWLKADPEDHMTRVIAQGDLRPMSASREAMDDLRDILAAREAFYSKADHVLDTSLQPLEQTFEKLVEIVSQAFESRAPGTA